MDHLRCRSTTVLALCMGIFRAFLIVSADLSVAPSPWDFLPGGIFGALLPAAQMAGNPGNRDKSGGQRRSRSVGRLRFLLPPGGLEPGLVSRFYHSTAGSAGVVSSLSGFEFYDCVLGSGNPVCTKCKIIHLRLFPL